MKILIFSDSHRKISKMLEIIKKNSVEIGMVIHLGDNIADTDYIKKDFPDIPLLAVPGNCDSYVSDISEIFVCIEHLKYLLRTDI